MSEHVILDSGPADGNRREQVESRLRRVIPEGDIEQAVVSGKYLTVGHVCFLINRVRLQISFFSDLSGVNHGRGARSHA